MVAGDDGRGDLRLHRAVDRHVPVFDAALHLRARRVGELIGDVHVEPLRGGVAGRHVEDDEGLLLLFRISHADEGTRTTAVGATLVVALVGFSIPNQGDHMGRPYDGFTEPAAICVFPCSATVSSASATSSGVL